MITKRNNRMDKAVDKDLFTRVQSIVRVGLILLSLQLVFLSKNNKNN